MTDGIGITICGEENVLCVWLVFLVTRKLIVVRVLLNKQPFGISQVAQLSSPMTKSPKFPTYTRHSCKQSITAVLVLSLHYAMQVLFVAVV